MLLPWFLQPAWTYWAIHLGAFHSKTIIPSLHFQEVIDIDPGDALNCRTVLYGLRPQKYTDRNCTTTTNILTTCFLHSRSYLHFVRYIWIWLLELGGSDIISEIIRPLEWFEGKRVAANLHPTYLWKTTRQIQLQTGCHRGWRLCMYLSGVHRSRSSLRAALAGTTAIS